MCLLRPETLKWYVDSAKSILVTVAKKQTFITYQDLMARMGGPGRGHIARVLEEVCATESENNRPMLASLVVHQSDSLPGDGFWRVRTLPLSIKNGSRQEKLDFWQREHKRAWEYWQHHNS